MIGDAVRIEKLFKKTPLLRAKELEAAGIRRVELTRFVAAGKLKRLKRGIYCLPDYRQNEHGDIAIVAKRMPDVLICLLSALRFHELTTQAPAEIWVAIARASRPPRSDYPELKVTRFGEAAFRYGVVTKVIEGVPVRVTTIEKTVADCFKFRNKIGLDVAIEALKEAGHRGIIDQNKLWECAKVDRVTNVMRPYMEALA